MGTRRSRHNKGRKPLYKDHRSVASNLLAHKMYGGGWFNTRTWWTNLDQFKLEILCEADSDIEASADCLGRSDTSIAWRARDCGFTLPPQWARLIAPKKLYKPVDRRPRLAYPYIVKARPEHADILAINAIVPKAIPDDIRADICQAILVAILEGRTTLDILRSRDKSAAYFIRKFYTDNYEQAGHALSFDTVGGDDNDERSYDEIASSIAAKEWHAGQFFDRNRYTDSLRTFTPPAQIEAVWQDQIGRAQLKAHELGQFLSFEETAMLLDGNDDA